jgi:RNA polymerase primary sigma factor
MPRTPPPTPHDTASRFPERERAGDGLSLYLKDIERYPRLSREEENRLGALAIGGDVEARDQLIQGNLRLVVAIARRYLREKLQFLDLIQQGNQGLIRAAEKWDPTRGVPFGAYAPNWIERYLKEYLARQSYVASIPLYRADTFVRVQKARQLLVQSLDREPTLDEIAHVADLTRADVEEASRFQQSEVYLDAPVGDDGGGATLADQLPDDQSAAPDDAVSRKEMRVLIDSALEILHERERRVLIMYFGLQGNPERNLEQIGVELGITRERVRQIKEKGLEKLLHSGLVDIAPPGRHSD